jgi:hypothetical protein
MSSWNGHSLLPVWDLGWQWPPHHLWVFSTATSAQPSLTSAPHAAVYKQLFNVSSHFPNKAQGACPDTYWLWACWTLCPMLEHFLPPSGPGASFRLQALWKSLKNFISNLFKKAFVICFVCYLVKTLTPINLSLSKSHSHSWLSLSFCLLI